MSGARLLIQAGVIVLLSSVAGGAVLGIGMLGFGVEDANWGKGVGVCAVTAIHSALAVGAGALMRRGRLVGLNWLAVGIGGCAVLVWTALICFDLTWQASERFALSGVTLSVTMIGIVYTGGFLSLRTRSATLRGLRAGVITAAWLFGFLSLMFAWLGEAFSRVLPDATFMVLVVGTGLVGSVALLGSLIVRVLIVMVATRERAATESIARRIRVELSCPGCRAELELPTGAGRCPACGFTMHIEVEEPRCECGYLVYQLAGDTCPECGRAVPESARWRGEEASG